MKPSDICFVGLGTTAVCYYRVVLPAQAIGADWCGLNGFPPKFQWATGLVGGSSKPPRLHEYKVVVLQQPRGKGWLNLIRSLQEQGVKVLYEIDDYIHAIRKHEDHDFRKEFGKERLAEHELCMGVCDGLIASTEYIARRYKRFNANTFTCLNGIDIARYDLRLPERPTVNIGWAGATGHRNSIMPWLASAAKVMAIREQTCFVSIGQPFANGFKRHFGPQRALAVPWAAIEQYPAAMTLMDIALAPAGRGGFYKGKSDLRWLEAGALGVPIIADPLVYPDIEPGVTGFHAEESVEIEDLLLQLIDDAELRTQVGRNAREHIRATRSHTEMSRAWIDVFEEVVGEGLEQHTNKRS